MKKLKIGLLVILMLFTLSIDYVYAAKLLDNEAVEIARKDLLKRINSKDTIRTTEVDCDDDEGGICYIDFLVDVYNGDFVTYYYDINNSTGKIEYLYNSEEKVFIDDDSSSNNNNNSSSSSGSSSSSSSGSSSGNNSSSNNNSSSSNNGSSSSGGSSSSSGSSGTSGCDVNLYADGGTFETDSSVTLYYTNGPYPSYRYDIFRLESNETDGEFLAYCRDAGLPGKLPNSGNRNFGCDRTIFDPTLDPDNKGDFAQLTYDAGIIAILKNGKGNSSDVNYIATNIALRIYEKAWILEGKNNPHALNEVMDLYTKFAFQDTEISNLFNQLSKEVGSGYINAAKVYTNKNFQTEITSWMSGGKDIQKQIKDQALDLVRYALDASLDYATGKSTAKLTFNEKPTTKIEVKDGKNQATHTYTFKIENFASDGRAKVEVKCPECTKNGVKFRLSVGDSTSTKTSLDLKRYNNKGESQLNVIFTSPNATCNIATLEYELVLTYYDKTIATEAYVMADEGCTSCQSFYVLYAEDVERTKKIENEVDLCNMKCEDAKAACEKGDTVACKIYKEKYNENCVECSTIINNADCTYAENTDISVTEGYDVSNCSNAQENTLSCVINNEDPAGNSYQAKTSEFNNTANNNYCSVWCKEDYHFQLPGIKAVNSGGYFTLDVGVKGYKTCTAKIEVDKFNTDFKTLQSKMLDAYNKYSRLYAIVHGERQDASRSYKHGCQRKNGRCRGCSSSICDIRRILLDYMTYTLDDKGNIQSHRNQYTMVFGSTEKRGSCNYRCNSYSKEYNAQNFEGQLKNAEAELQKLVSQLKNLVNTYTPCSGQTTYQYDDVFNASNSNYQGWKMTYNYNPTISFYYEESYYNYLRTNIFDTVGNYNFSGLTESFYGKADEGDAMPDNPVSEFPLTNSKFVCYKSGSKYVCGWKTIYLTQAHYVVQKMDVSAQYITPTQMYNMFPTGTIAIADEGKEDDIENSSELTNSLAVGVGTKQGVFNYAIMVQNLGEFYNNGKLGRIWGDEKSVVKTVVSDKDECSQSLNGDLVSKLNGTSYDDGVYVCSYTVNLTGDTPECPSGECDIVCDEDGCINKVCPKDDCEIECDKCIYNNSSGNISYRPITPSDVNPNNKYTGVNWIFDDKLDTALEIKAYVTTEEIETAGESIYDISYEDQIIGDGSDAEDYYEYAMTVHLDREMITKIKKYNEEHKEDGYANNTLKCYDYKSGGKTYDNIFCYSTFIDELLYDNDTADNIKIVGNRIIGTNAKDSDNLRSKKTQDSGYWTVWSEANTKDWKISSSIGFNYKEIGPSWK